MNILVTGGCGFVGRHLTKRLLDLGHNVTIVDNIYPGSGGLPVYRWPEHLKPTEEEESRLVTEYRDCREYFKSYNILEKAKWPVHVFEQVYHLAAVVGGRLVIENDPLAVALDLSIDAEFFHWASRLPYKPKFHYFSSSAAYPIWMQSSTVKFNPLDEKFQGFSEDGGFGVPDMTYGWAKLTGEFLARTLHQKYGHDIICYRPFSGYGEDQDLTYPFPSILKRVMDGENPITVWGSGNQTRDFIYIEDCVDGILQLSDKIHDGSAVNLSTGKGTSFNELAALMIKSYNLPPILKIQNTSDKPEGVFNRVGSILLQEELGFKAKTTIEEGIKKSIQYINAAKSISSDPTL